jgi:hypothetical protein
MKKFFVLLCSVPILIIGLSGQAAAEGSWWDTGVEILQGIGGNGQGSESADGRRQVTSADISAAFKQALRLGTENVVNQLGAEGGFNADPAIHIPLPPQLQEVKTMLAKIGMASLAEDLELKLNRAAEAATPKAKELFLQAIQEMTFTDLTRIYEGPKDSATQYFQGKMSEPLRAEMRPVVENTLSQVGAVNAYDRFVGRYAAIPLVPDVKADLTQHVLDKGLEGIFFYLAKEEASIRQNPVRQTTTLLKKVFGASQ